MNETNNGGGGQMARITSEDGFTFEAFHASPQGESKGGLIILQEIFGATDQLKSVARSWADDGFDAIVPALFDRNAPGTVVPFDEPDRGREIALGLDPAKVQLDVAAAVKYLAGLSDGGKGVSVIGFCWGGGQAFRLACSLELTSAVSFYGTAMKIHMEKNPGGPKCPMLFHIGETDDHTPPEIIEAIRQAVPTGEFHTYDAGHAFANDARPTYVDAAAVPARQRTLEFLNKHHGA